MITDSTTAGSVSGDVISSTAISVDNRLALYDGTGGNTIKQSAAIIDSSGALSGITQLDVDNLRLNGNSLISTNVNGDISLTPNGSGSVNLHSVVIDSTNDVTGLIGLEVSGANNTNITSTLAADPSIVLNSNNASGGIEIQQQGVDRIKIDSTGLGFFNSAPIAKPEITGTRSANPALADLLTDLASLGLITDSTTAGSVSGDVTSSTGTSVDNRLALYDGTGGNTIKQSTAVIDSSAALSGITGLEVSTGAVDFNSISSLDVLTSDNTATAINLIATGGTTTEVHIENTTGTSSDSVRINSDLGGLDIDCELQMNLRSEQAGFNAIHIHAGNAAGGVEIDSDAGIFITNSDVEGLIFDDSTSAFNVSMKASSLTTASHDFILPTSGASINGQVLSSTTAGVTSWATISAGSDYPPGYLDGGGLEWVSNSTINVKAANCRDSADGFNIILASNTLLTLSSTGSAGGLQVAEASNTIYKVYAIADSNEVNVSNTWGVPQGTAISLPGTHDVYRFMGSIKNNSSSNVLNFEMHGQGRMRHYHYHESRSTLEVYNSGGTAGVFTNLDLDDLIPEGITMADFSIELDMDADSHKFYMQSGINAQSTSNSLLVIGGGIQAADFQFADFMIYNQALDPTGGTGSVPSVEWGTDVVGQDVTISVSAYTQNL